MSTAVCSSEFASREPAERSESDCHLSRYGTSGIRVPMLERDEERRNKRISDRRPRCNRARSTRSRGCARVGAARVWVLGVRVMGRWSLTPVDERCLRSVPWMCRRTVVSSGCRSTGIRAPRWSTRRARSWRCPSCGSRSMGRGSTSRLCTCCRSTGRRSRSGDVRRDTRFVCMRGSEHEATSTSRGRIACSALRRAAKAQHRRGAVTAHRSGPYAGYKATTLPCP